VAGLPAVRRPARRVGDVPVPRARAAARRGRLGRERRYGRLGSRSKRREARQAVLALAGRADGGQRVRLVIVEIRAEPLLAHDLAVANRQPGTFLELALLQLQLAVVGDDIE